MTLITNERNTKAVRIETDATGRVYAAYIQRYIHGFAGYYAEDVIECKSFASVKNAERWAAKVLA